jgi:hypothetical protein
MHPNQYTLTPKDIYRGRAKSGTSHFHAYASCYVVHKGRRAAALAVARSRLLQCRSHSVSAGGALSSHRHARGLPEP